MDNGELFNSCYSTYYEANDLSESWLPRSLFYESPNKLTFPLHFLYSFKLGKLLALISVPLSFTLVLISSYWFNLVVDHVDTVPNDLQTYKEILFEQCRCSLLVLSETLQVNPDLCINMKTMNDFGIFCMECSMMVLADPPPPHLTLSVSVLPYFVSEPLLLLLIWSELNWSELLQLWQLCAWNGRFADRILFCAW